MQGLFVLQTFLSQRKSGPSKGSEQGRERQHRGPCNSGKKWRSCSGQIEEDKIKERQTLSLHMKWSKVQNVSTGESAIMADLGSSLLRFSLRPYHILAEDTAHTWEIALTVIFGLN